MRLKLLQAIAVASITLFPLAGEASLISSDSAIPGITSAVNAGDHPTTGADSSSLIDSSGNPVLLVVGSDSFEHQDGQDKLRDWSGIFEADGGACCGSGGGGGGGSLPGLGSFGLPSFGEQSLNLNLDLNLDLNLPLGDCCECNECGGGNGQTVPEPSMFVLAASGLALGLRRVMSRRGGAGVRG